MLASVHQIVELYVVPLQLALAMFGMGATLYARDFLGVARAPKAALVGLGLQLVFMPCFTLAFTRATGMSPGWATGLVLVAVAPGGAFSNLLTLIARGNVPLSVSVTAITMVICLGSVPLLLGLLAGPYLPATFVMPTARILRDITLFLLLPLVLGMLHLRLRPTSSSRLSNLCVRASTWLLLAFVISSIASGRISIAAYGWRPPALLCLFGGCIALAVPLLCRALRMPDTDAVALSIEVVVRNVGLSLLLVRFFFPDAPEQGHVIYTVLFYGGMMMTLVVPQVVRHRAGKAPLWGLSPRPAVESGGSR